MLTSAGENLPQDNKVIQYKLVDHSVTRGYYCLIKLNILLQNGVERNAASKVHEFVSHSATNEVVLVHLLSN